MGGNLGGRFGRKFGRKIWAEIWAEDLGGRFERRRWRNIWAEVWADISANIWAVSSVDQPRGYVREHLLVLAWVTHKISQSPAQQNISTFFGRPIFFKKRFWKLLRASDTDSKCLKPQHRGTSGPHPTPPSRKQCKRHDLDWPPYNAMATNLPDINAPSQILLVAQVRAPLLEP